MVENMDRFISGYQTLEVKGLGPIDKYYLFVLYSKFTLLRACEKKKKYSKPPNEKKENRI